MVVAAFVKGMTTSPLSNSLIRYREESLSEVREQATTHIEAEEVVLGKNNNSRSKQPRYKVNGRDRSSRSDEVSTSKQSDQRYVPYIAKKDDPKNQASEEKIIRPKLWVSYKELMGMANVVDKLNFP